MGIRAHIGFLLGALLAPAAQAQLSGSIALASDYLYRGISLSDRRPALQGTLAYDHDSGWYAGAFASNVQFVKAARSDLQLMAFAGRSERLTNRLSWDAGFASSTFARDSEYSFTDFYTGFTLDTLGLRIHYAARYFGQASDALYAEINTKRPLGEHLDFVAHLGILRNNNTGDDACCGQDIRAGVGFNLWGLDTELTAAAISANHPSYPMREGLPRAAVILALSRSF